jgi:hypothetical protein
MYWCMGQVLLMVAVPTVISSTRAELFGIAAPNEFLFHFMKFHNIELMSKCVMVIHNRAAISRVNHTQGEHSCRWQYSDVVDIVIVIVDFMKASTLQHELQCMKAHQDNKKLYEENLIWGVI